MPLKKVRKKDTIEMILSRPPMIVKSSLSQLRYHILIDGLKVPKDSEDVSDFSFSFFFFFKPRLFHFTLANHIRASVRIVRTCGQCFSEPHHSRPRST